MLKLSNACLFALLVLIIGCQRVELPEGLVDFGKTFKKHHNAQNTSALFELYCWDDVSAELRQSILQAYYYEQDIPIRDIAFQEYIPEQHDSIYYPATFKPNLQPLWIMYVRYDTENSQELNLLVGKQGDMWTIVNPTQP